MSWKHYENLDENLFSCRLQNGLRVRVVPRPGFSRCLAYYATDFGAIHTDFVLDGQEYHVPAGVAHFLEHKMFELPDRDVTAEFAALGANVNAFTSFDMTAYYFSCTARFEQALALLLEFVSTPYFTRESVEREYGIIDQEIAMNDDDAGSQEFSALMGKMYRNHPVRTEVLGTRESIRRITPQILHDCHRAFYTPDNMVLCVIGDVQPERVVQIAERILGTHHRPTARKLRHWPEEMVCDTAPARLYQEVALPSYQIGFKCEPADRGAQALRADVVGYLAAEVLLGESSPLYLRLYEEGIVDSSFGGSFETIDGCAMLTCGGDGHQAEQVRDAILEEAARIAETGVDERDLLRMKRGALGRRIRDLDSFDALCYRLCAYSLLDYDYLQFPGVYASVTAEELRAFISRVVVPRRCALVQTFPQTQTGNNNSAKEE